MPSVLPPVGFDVVDTTISIETRENTTLLLIRHGQSTWNAEGRWQGQADPPLTSFGRQQAAAAAERIGAVDAIVSSTQQRAAETATIISEALGVGPVAGFDGLRERNAGPWSGLTRHEIDASYPGFLDNDQRPEGYESDDRLLSRTLSAIGRIADAHVGSTIVVATHGGVIHNLEQHLGLVDGRVPNLAGRVFHLSRSGLMAGEKLRLLDEAFLTGGDPRRL